MINPSNQVLVFLTVFTIAIVTPGPNFVLVVSSSLKESRRHGVMTAFGVATGSALFAATGLLGLIVVAFSWPPMREVMRFFGGGYLLWLGVDTLRKVRPAVDRNQAQLDNIASSLASSYRRGLITNLTNPKAWAFYISLFTLILTPHFDLPGKLSLLLAMFLISFGWYALVAFMISHPLFRARMVSWHPYIQTALGILLLVFGARVLLNW